MDSIFFIIAVIIILKEGIRSVAFLQHLEIYVGSSPSLRILFEVQLFTFVEYSKHLNILFTLSPMFLDPGLNRGWVVPGSIASTLPWEE